MKIIKPNNIELGELQNLNDLLSSPANAIKNLIKIKDEHIQYVKSERDTDLISNGDMNPFVQAVHLAYASHLPLVISPDAIWYLITNAAAIHINKNAEDLRDKFVNHQGKKVIRVRRDEFRLNAPNPWHEVIDEFSTKIGENTKNEIADILVSNFTTTSKIARVSSQIVLMDSMQKYFDYRFSTMCGIPEIRLTGEKSDWKNLKSKTEKLFELIPDFQVWMKNSLGEILDNFIEAFDDKIKNEFWNSIYKISGGSGGPFVSGWIISLFPYLDDHKNHYVWETNWKSIKERSFGGGVTTSSFGYHMSKAPFTWEYFSQEIKMLFVGGLIGIAYEKDKSLVPVFGYAVTEDKLQTNPEDAN